MSARLPYQQQDSGLTLREGLASYATLLKPHAAADTQSDSAGIFFRRHDVVHVVFGCDVSLKQEMIVKISTFAGTTAGLTALKGYRLAESRLIYRRIGLAETVTMAVKALVIVPRTLWRCWRMSRRWPWEGYEQYLDQPLATLRDEFGIRVAD